MKIPFGLPIIDDKEKNAVLKVLSQPVLAHGKQTSEFEKKFTSFTKAKTSISRFRRPEIEKNDKHIASRFQTPKTRFLRFCAIFGAPEPNNPPTLLASSVWKHLYICTVNRKYVRRARVL